MKASLVKTDQTGVPRVAGPPEPRMLKAFARHETFHPRYGWLKKGFDAVVQQPDVFTRPDATVTLGVGKNMVRAIRYWCRAFKLLEEYPRSNTGRLLDARPASFGIKLMGADGWDPYLERAGSLWLLHWMLVRPPCLAPSWSIVLNATSLDVFTESDLVRELRLYCEGEDEWGDVAEQATMGYSLCMLRAGLSSLNSNYRDPYLLAIWSELDDPSVVEDKWFTGYESDPRRLPLTQSGTTIRCVSAGFELSPPPLAGDAERFAVASADRGLDANNLIRLSQVEVDGHRVDTVDRIQVGADIVRSLVAAGL